MGFFFFQIHLSGLHSRVFPLEIFPWHFSFPGWYWLFNLWVSLVSSTDFSSIWSHPPRLPLSSQLTTCSVKAGTPFAAPESVPSRPLTVPLLNEQCRSEFSHELLPSFHSRPVNYCVFKCFFSVQRTNLTKVPAGSLPNPEFALCVLYSNKSWLGGQEAKHHLGC